MITQSCCLELCAGCRPGYSSGGIVSTAIWAQTDLFTRHKNQIIRNGNTVPPDSRPLGKGQLDWDSPKYLDVVKEITNPHVPPPRPVPTSGDMLSAHTIVAAPPHSGKNDVEKKGRCLRFHGTSPNTDTNLPGHAHASAVRGFYKGGLALLTGVGPNLFGAISPTHPRMSNLIRRWLS